MLVAAPPMPPGATTVMAGPKTPHEFIQRHHKAFALLAAGMVVVLVLLVGKYASVCWAHNRMVGHFDPANPVDPATKAAADTTAAWQKRQAAAAAAEAAAAAGGAACSKLWDPAATVELQALATAGAASSNHFYGRHNLLAGIATADPRYGAGLEDHQIQSIVNG